MVPDFCPQGRGVGLSRVNSEEFQRQARKSLHGKRPRDVWSSRQILQRVGIGAGAGSGRGPGGVGGIGSGTSGNGGVGSGRGRDCARAWGGISFTSFGSGAGISCGKGPGCGSSFGLGCGSDGGLGTSGAGFFGSATAASPRLLPRKNPGHDLMFRKNASTTGARRLCAGQAASGPSYDSPSSVT